MADLSNLNGEFDNTMNALRSVWEKAKGEIENASSNAEKRYSNLKKDYDELKIKYDEAQARIDRIDGQLKDTVQRLESMQGETNKDVDALKLLDVYLVLMEQVFESGPHVRLLLILHGDKEEWDLNELVQASGISALKVRQAMHELRNANVLTYNEDTGQIVLTQRFM